MSHIGMLRNLGACTEGIEYASKYDTLQAAWDACENPSFMLWLLHKQNREEDLYRCACVFARSVLHLYEVQYPGDPRVQAAIECKERWIEGNATNVELGDARAAARDAAWDAEAAVRAAACAARAAAWDAEAAARDAAARDTAWAVRAAARDTAWAVRAAACAARAAARDAAWDAEAARAAARDAAEAAAWDAARDAAWAAGAAAWDAAQCNQIRSVVPCV